MKRTLVQRFAILMMAVVMVVGGSFSAFAAEDVTEKNVVQFKVSADGGEIMPLNNPGRMTVGQWNGTASCYPTLDSYIGFYKNFRMISQSSGDGGALTLYLTNPNGEIISNDWYLGPNDEAVYNFFLPISGTYTLTATALGTSADVYVTCYWE